MKYLALFLSLFILFGCSKVKSKKWLVAEIHVVDGNTGEKLPCDFSLSYTVSTFLGSYQEEVDLGFSDENGMLLIEREITKKQSGFKLNIYNYSGHYGLYPYSAPRKTIDLYKKSENLNHVELLSKSYVVMSIFNANCAGPTDTLLIHLGNGPFTGGGYAEYVGCVDTVLNGGMEYVGLITDPILELQYIVKRGAQVDTFQETHTLTPKEFTPISITY